MTWTRSPAGRAVLILTSVIAVTLATPFALRAFGFNGSFWIRTIVALAIVIPAAIATRHYWLSIDEAAREAQKWAWFWGGTAGMALGLVALLLGPAAPGLAPGFVALVPPTATPAGLMASGAIALSIAQLVGFSLAWAWWWATRR